MADMPTRVAGVALRCSDVELSAELYRRVVGLEPSEIGLERAELRAPGGGATLLTLRRAEHGGQVPKRATGLFHTAFRYPTRVGLAAALGRVAAAGAHLNGVADHGVSEALYLDDPDGFGIELYRDRPREQWPEPGPGERVGMFTEPLDLTDLASVGIEEAGAEGVEIGHVHLKVADPDEAAAFWIEEVGMELMTRFGADAVFCGFGGYHHHVGANAWLSRNAGSEPADGPGLEAITVDASGESLRTPDGLRVRRSG